MKDDTKIWIPVIIGMMGIAFAHYFWYDLSPSKTITAINFGFVLFTITLLIVASIEWIFTKYQKVHNPTKM